MGQTSKKQGWTPTEPAFRRFLAWLDDGTDSSGERYLDMRKRLVRYFDNKQCITADDLADETLNRVVRRLDEEGTITDASPTHYCYIVAKFVFLEHLREIRPQVDTEDSDLDSLAYSSGGGASTQEVMTAQERLDCLDRCLGKLPSADRTLILEYYQGEQGEKIQRRRELAEQLALSTNALSIRACRIRDRLEECVVKCTQS
jgi:RNA polymerase sigma factor (sigma-70 family)